MWGTRKFSVEVENQPANKQRSVCPTKCEANSKTKPKLEGQRKTADGQSSSPVAALGRESQVSCYLWVWSVGELGIKSSRGEALPTAAAMAGVLKAEVNLLGTVLLRSQLYYKSERWLDRKIIRNLKKGRKRKIGDPQNCPGVLGLHLSEQNIQKSF